MTREERRFRLQVNGEHIILEVLRDDRGVVSADMWSEKYGEEATFGSYEGSEEGYARWLDKAVRIFGMVEVHGTK